MSVSSDLILELVKATKGPEKQKTETTVYGTVVKHNGSNYVRLDGSELLTPIATTADTIPGERVTVLIKNHTAIVTGNISSPAARTDDLKNVQLNADEIGNKIAEFEIVVADKVSTQQLDAERARIDELRAEDVFIKGRLDAHEADIGKLETDSLEVRDILTATEADIEELRSKKLDAEIADLTYATIVELNSTNADIHNLGATYAAFEVATTTKFASIDAKIENLEVGNFDAVYANVDFSNIGKAAIEQFFSTSGLIENVIVGDQTVTGRLVGITISGDLIEGNTVKADKLVIKGEDGLYYKLNTDGMTTEAEQTDENSLNGSIIKAKSISATKVAVNDLVAFDATIGGFNITEHSIYSEVKDSDGNTTRGIYMDVDGQFNFGDGANYVKYYKDESGNYKLAISAESILYALNGKQYSIADLGKLGEYIHIGVYEGEPCIELGESDSDFRLIITNTRILFMEGTDLPAYVNNKSLHIKKAVVEEELHQGGFMWKIRSNGNMGLVWKGE